MMIGGCETGAGMRISFGLLAQRRLLWHSKLEVEGFCSQPFTTMLETESIP
jgi:hypothetical protein